MLCAILQTDMDPRSLDDTDELTRLRARVRELESLRQREYLEDALNDWLSVGLRSRTCRRSLTAPDMRALLQFRKQRNQRVHPTLPVHAARRLLWSIREPHTRQAFQRMFQALVKKT